MGFLDNLESIANRATSSVERTGRKAQLNIRLGDVNKRRTDLLAQLGASLYNVVKDMPEFRLGREAIFDAIAALDAERVQLEQQISAVEGESEAARAAAVKYNCTACGAVVQGGDMFCSVCGKSVAEIVAEINAQMAAAQQAYTQQTQQAYQATQATQHAAAASGGQTSAQAPAAQTSSPATDAASAESAKEPNSVAGDDAAAQSSKCPKCSHDILPTDKFCFNCGQQLG